MISRRQLLRTGTAALAGLTLPLPFGCSGPRKRDVKGSTPERDFVVESVDRTTVRLEYRPAPKRAMDRELPHWRYSEIFEVQLRSGAVGLGETLLYYTWGASDDEDVQRVIGANALDVMWDDTIGAGLQIALFDAVARTADVPVHRLLGHQIYDKTPLSWWNIDTSASDMAAECKLAYETGYMSYKTKGRPWFDLYQQVGAATGVVPESFKIDMDFNDTLRDADRALPILKDLERFPQIDIYESPIPQGDVEGNRLIRKETRVKIAMHYGNPKPRTVVMKETCDGFVVGGGASNVLRQGAFASQVDMPFWLQLVGTDITAAWSLHFGAVLSHATWPAVNCHQLYTTGLLKSPIAVKEGFAAIPTGPGLGYELDRDAVEKHRVEKPKERPDPPRLIETIFADGRRMYVANDGKVNFMLRLANEEKMPFYLRGVYTRGIPRDDSGRWKEMWEKAREAAPLIVDR